MRAGCIPGAIVLLISLVGCAGPDGGAPPDEVTGMVVDALSGAPIAGARVEAEGQEGAWTTDDRGRFSAPAADAYHARAGGHLSVVSRTGDRVLALWPVDPSDEAVDRHLARLERDRALRDDPSDPALREEARAWIRGERPALEVPEGDVGAVRAALDAPPATIRIWRRSIDGASASCDGRVDVIDFEDYVRGVLPHEWIPSWHDESLRAGALSIRTYAWQWVARGGKYDCADLDDTARSQVYRDESTERATAAVDDTRGMAITREGVMVSGEYSAENGDPTDFGVEDPLCRGFEIRGHRRGMCQWGSQRWADQMGYDHLWIAEHYWPGATVEGGGEPLPDYDARLIGGDAPATLVSGETAEVSFELENTGRRSWMAGATYLDTDDGEPSPFFDPVNWVDPTRATGPDAFTVTTSEAVRFTFRVRAPEVEAEETITEGFGLQQDGGERFGPALSMTMTVIPREVGATEDGGPGRLDAGDAGGGLEGGCGVARRRPAGGLGWLAVAIAALVARRRRVP